jgi:hypothetical protein
MPAMMNACLEGHNMCDHATALDCDQQDGQA